MFYEHVIVGTDFESNSFGLSCSEVVFSVSWKCISDRPSKHIAVRQTFIKGFFRNEKML